MIRRIINKTLICVMIPIATISCSLLSVDSEDHVARNDIYAVLGDAWAIKIGLYGSMQDLMEQYFVLGELRGDLVTPARGARANRDMLEFMEHNISLDNKYLDWSGFYRLINQCNEALVSLPVVKQKNPDFEEHWFNHIMGEVLWIRAWAYLTLVKNWGDVPFITKPVYSVQDVQPLEPASQDVILDQLEIDLAWAVEQVWVNWSWAGMPKYWNHETVNMAAAVNLLGDVLLHRDKYEQAWSKSALQKVVEPGVFTVQPGGGREYWNDSFKLGAGDNRLGDNGQFWFDINFRYAMEDYQRSWIFQGLVLAFDTEAQYDGGTYYKNHTLGQITSNRPEWGEQYIVKPSIPAIINWKFPADDINRGEGYSYYIDGQDTLIWKYIGLNRYGERRGSDRRTGSGNINIHRVADLYLRGAEAAARLGSTERAITIIRDCRGAVHAMPPALQISASIEEIEDAIMTERASELAFEMYRWYDLVRIAKRRNDPNYLIDRVVAAAPADKRDELRARLEIQSLNWWKLPYGNKAMQMNPNLVNK